MYEYRISVAIDGKFYFRTEWDTIAGRVNEAALGFIDRYGIDSVTVSRRNLVIETAQGFEHIERLFKP